MRLHPDAVVWFVHAVDAPVSGSVPSAPDAARSAECAAAADCPPGGHVREWQRSTNLFAALLIGAGVAFRTIQYLSVRSLWIDEARLAVGIAGRTFAGLLHPLPFDQAAPPLFLWAAKAVTSLFGVHELSLRLVPLMAGIASLLLMLLVCRRLLTPGASLLALGLLAFSPAAIFYSNELKPYSLDLAVCLWLVWCSLRVLEAPDARSRWYTLLVSGVLAVWASMPSVFVILPSAAVILARRYEGDGTPAWRARAAAAVWVASFLVAYLAVYRQSGANLHRGYWAPSFFSPGSLGFPENIWLSLRASTWAFFFGHAGEYYPVGVFSAGLAVLAVLGIAVLGARRFYARQRHLQFVLLVGPVAAAMAAAAVGAYPFGTRVVLFTAPLWMLVAAAGMEAIVARTAPSFRRRAWSLTLVAALALPICIAVIDAIVAPRPQHTRPLVASLLKSAEPGEPIYLLAGSLPAWAFYATDWQRPDTALLAFHSRLGSSGGAAFENAGPRHAPIGAEGVEREVNGHPIIYGVPSGTFRRSLRQYNTTRLDAGWAEHEASRIKAHANPTAWVLMSHILGPEMQLLEALSVVGAEAVDTLAQPGAALLRYRFHPASAPDQ